MTTIMVDASALKQSSCRRRLFWEIFSGYKVAVPNVELLWGSAFHKFRAIWREKRDENLAIAEAVTFFKGKTVKIKANKSYLNSLFLMEAAAAYVEKYKNDDFLVAYVDGKPLIEPNTKFFLPFYENSKYKVVLAGTKDEIGKWRVAGNYSICDLKTTATWKVRNYLESYALNPQLLFYRSILRHYAKQFPDSVFAEIAKTNVTCFIEGAFYKSSDTGGKIDFKRSEEFIFKDEQLDEFDNQVSVTVRQLVEDIENFLSNNILPPREGMVNDSCATKYGPCKYFRACASCDKEEMRYHLENDFIKIEYNPLTW